MTNIPGQYPHFIEFLNFIFKALDLSPEKFSKNISRWKNEDYLSYDKKTATLNAVINEIVDSIKVLTTEQAHKKVGKLHRQMVQVQLGNHLGLAEEIILPKSK